AIQASIELGNAEARGRWFEIALAGDTRPRRIAARARRAFAQAERAASSEDLDTSIKRLGESAALFNDSFLPMAETVTRRRRAELLLGRNIGDRDAAQAELGRILPYWRRAKATWYLGQLKRWATALGLDFPVETPERATPRTREPRAQLTTREREVAALVAAGLSNKGDRREACHQRAHSRGARRAHLGEAPIPFAKPNRIVASGRRPSPPRILTRTHA